MEKNIFRGNAFEIGRQYGAKFAEKIRCNLSILVWREGYEPLPLQAPDFIKWADAQEKVISTHWPWLIEEMHAVAEGSGFNYRDILLLNLRSWQYNLCSGKAALAVEACSSLIITLADGTTANIGALDVGGESTRPGAKSVSEQDEITRVSETIQLIKKKYPNQLISLDTRKSKVMQHGLSIGVDMLNDVSALDFDPQSYQVIKDSGKPIVLNHSQGIPEDMQNNPTYENVLLDIFDYFENKIKFLKDNGIKDEQIIIDPGIGFGKTLEHNLEIISKISLFHGLGYPIMVGPSRKSFIGKIMGEKDNPQRLGGTIASVLYSYLQGIQLFRVHDIQETNEALKVYSQFLKQ